jgi:hypothetical protein
MHWFWWNCVIPDKIRIKFSVSSAQGNLADILLSMLFSRNNNMPVHINRDVRYYCCWHIKIQLASSILVSGWSQFYYLIPLKNLNFLWPNFSISGMKKCTFWISYPVQSLKLLSRDFTWIHSSHDRITVFFQSLSDLLVIGWSEDDSCHEEPATSFPPTIYLPSVSTNSIPLIVHQNQQNWVEQHSVI